jgi:hypothetical protein
MFYVPLLFLCQPADGRRWLLSVAAASTVLIVVDLALGIGGAASPQWVLPDEPRRLPRSCCGTIALLLRRSVRLEAEHKYSVERAAALTERPGARRHAADLRRMQADVQRSDDAWQSVEDLHPGALRGLVLARACARRACLALSPARRPVQ